MKLTDFKSALLPHKYFAIKSKNIRSVLFLLLCAYLVSFICVTCSIKSFTDGIYNDVTEFIASSDDFYLTEEKFTFIGNEKECYIRNINSVLNVDSDADYRELPEKGEIDPLISVFIAGNGINIKFNNTEYSASVSELYAQYGELDFTKADVDNYLNENANVLFNVVFSVFVFVAVLLLLVLTIAILLISLIIRLLNSPFKCNLDFKQIMFVSVGSFIYPVLFSGLIFLFPNGILFYAVYCFDILRLLVAAVLLYILCAIYPFLTATSKDNKAKE